MTFDREPAATQWQEIGPQCWVRANSGFAMNTGLVIGTKRALVIDSGAGPLQAQEIYDGVRQRTPLPLVVVNTHAHFDHFYGNAAFAALGVEDIWAASRCAETMTESAESQRPLVAQLEPAMAAGEGGNTAVVVPNKLVEGGSPVDLDLGGVVVTLFHLGRGHTDHDLLVGAGTVLFPGDLVEEGAGPSFGDSFPSDWIRTLTKIVALDDLYSTFVPGHGAPVGADFVRTQLEKMRAAVRVAKTAMDEASMDMTKAIPILPYGPEQSRALLIRLRTLADWKSLPA